MMTCAVKSKGRPFSWAAHAAMISEAEVNGVNSLATAERQVIKVSAHCRENCRMACILPFWSPCANAHVFLSIVSMRRFR